MNRYQHTVYVDIDAPSEEYSTETLDDIMARAFAMVPDVVAINCDGPVEQIGQGTCSICEEQIGMLEPHVGATFVNVERVAHKRCADHLASAYADDPTNLAI